MIFTQEDYKKIETYLAQKAIKDTDLPVATTVNNDDIVSIVQEGESKQAKIADILINNGIVFLQEKGIVGFGEEEITNINELKNTNNFDSIPSNVNIEYNQEGYNNGGYLWVCSPINIQEVTSFGIGINMNDPIQINDFYCYRSEKKASNKYYNNFKIILK